MREYFSNSEKETEQIASEFATELKSGDVLAYKGGMGVGKTAFTRGLATGLKVTGEVSSPTFALVHEYKSLHTGQLSLYHFDMYRIKTFEDVYSTGYFDYLDMEEIIAVEWSENVSEIFDENTIYIDIEKIDENRRHIKITGGNRF
ncbi:MAG: tRNA (adenosine(37)-N6)-threonylcarbamoyltransferase complex ATPase subunit type 1 TsaE [Oscillospiraceae bacterium]